jgi:TRAP transporter TAXI family solute receptor
MKFKSTLLMLAFSIFAIHSFAQLVILSGPEEGSYYPMVKDIEAVFADNDELTILNRATNGAAENYQQITNPESPYKVAMMQMDYLNYMKAVSMRDNDKVSDNIKIIVPLASEEIHLVSTKKKDYKDLKNLRDAVVGIGDKNQGTYTTASIIKDRSKVYWSSRNYHFDRALKELQLGNIDAFFIVGSAPIAKLDLSPEIMVNELILVPLNNFDGWADHYKPLNITTDDYKWLREDIPTFGVRTVLIVNEAKLTEDDRRQIDLLVNGLKEKHPELIENGHPKWAEVDLADWDTSLWPVLK